MADDPLTECPSCGGFVKRLIQNVPIVFKGSGWYVTDSRKSDTASANGKAKATEASGGDKPSEKPSETAKSAKTEAAPVAAD
jgi:predicted nucleic acid-binding Zn ribbon protein